MKAVVYFWLWAFMVLHFWIWLITPAEMYAIYALLVIKIQILFFLLFAPPIALELIKEKKEKQT